MTATLSLGHHACSEQVRDVCIDMSASYRAGLDEHLPWAAITFDEFHVIQLVNKAVDEVRRQELKTVPELKRSRYIWLKDVHEWNRKQHLQFIDLRALNLKTHRAFRIKESLREIFRCAQSPSEAEPLLERWYSWARRCRLEPIKKVAKTLKEHWQVFSTLSIPNSPTAASRPPIRLFKPQKPRLEATEPPGI